MSVQTLCIDGGCAPETRSTALVRTSLFDENRLAGVVVFASDATIEASVVRATKKRVDDGAYGDGLVVFGDAVIPAKATVRNTWIRDSARAGASSFGAHIVLAGTHIGCAAIELSGEPYNGNPFVFEDSGGNLCGCPIADHTCKNVSAGILPPEPVVSQ